jgi:4-hydroxybenzoate polyprenyltransferase
MHTVFQAIRLIRAHQWSKNLLIFVPLIVSPQLENIVLWNDLLIAFFAFNFCASAGYIINDIVDLPQDQMHPIKKSRPLASGFFSINIATCVAILLLSISIYLGILVGKVFCVALSLYFVIAQAYTLKLKQVHIIDCIILSFLYMMRIIAGALAVSLDLSVWILSFSLFFFFSFALLKRYSELSHHASGSNPLFGRGYTTKDLPLILNMGLPSALISILIIGLYITDEKIYSFYSEPKLLFLFLPILLIWVCSIWSRAIRGIEINDPISFALSDKTSILIFLASGLVFILARHGVMTI